MNAQSLSSKLGMKMPRVISKAEDYGRLLTIRCGGFWEHGEINKMVRVNRTSLKTRFFQICCLNLAAQQYGDSNRLSMAPGVGNCRRRRLPRAPRPAHLASLELARRPDGKTLRGSISAQIRSGLERI